MSPVKVLPLLLAWLLLAPAAQASGPDADFQVRGTPVSVQVASGVVTIDAGSCSTPIRYSVVPGALPEGGSYDVTAVLANQRGERFGSDTSVMEDEPTYRGSIYPRCTPKFVSGKYRVDVKVEVDDYYLSPIETREGSAVVRLAVSKPAPTSLVVRKSPYGRAGWQWTGRLTSNGKPVAGQRIDLWWDYMGWDDYEVSKRTNRSGIAHWVSNPNGGIGGINFRLKFSGSKHYAPSQSAVFNLAPR